MWLHRLPAAATDATRSRTRTVLARHRVLKLGPDHLDDVTELRAGATTQSIDVDVSPLGLLMIVPFFVVIVLAICRFHIVIALIWGSLSAIALGLLKPGAIFSIPAEQGGSSGIIEDGITGTAGVIIFVLFILVLAQLLNDSGIMASLLTSLERHAARGVRRAESMISGITLLFTVPLGTNAPAILLVGPTIGRPPGVKYDLAPARIANLMDCSANSVYYTLPWHNAVIVWYATLVTTATQYSLPLPSIASAFLNPYAWTLIIVLLVSMEPQVRLNESSSGRVTNNMQHVNRSQTSTSYRLWVRVFVATPAVNTWVASALRTGQHRSDASVFLFLALAAWDGYGVTNMSSLWLAVAIIAGLVFFPILGNFRPDKVSFLPSMRQYAGHWRTVREAEFVCNSLIGFNFGDGQLHNEALA